MTVTALYKVLESFCDKKRDHLYSAGDEVNLPIEEAKDLPVVLASEYVEPKVEKKAAKKKSAKKAK